VLAQSEQVGQLGDCSAISPG